MQSILSAPKTHKRNNQLHYQSILKLNNTLSPSTMTTTRITATKPQSLLPTSSKRQISILNKKSLLDDIKTSPSSPLPSDKAELSRLIKEAIIDKDLDRADKLLYFAEKKQLTSIGMYTQFISLQKDLASVQGIIKRITASKVERSNVFFVLLMKKYRELGRTDLVKTCFEDMKLEGKANLREAYQIMIEISDYDYETTKTYLQEMINANIELNIKTYKSVIRSCKSRSQLNDVMSIFSTTPFSKTSEETIIEAITNQFNKQIKMLTTPIINQQEKRTKLNADLKEMKENHVPLNVETYRMIMRIAASIHYPDSHQIASKYFAEMQTLIQSSTNEPQLDIELFNLMFMTCKTVEELLKYYEIMVELQVKPNIESLRLMTACRSVSTCCYLFRSIHNQHGVKASLRTTQSLLLLSTTIAEIDLVIDLLNEFGYIPSIYVFHAMLKRKSTTIPIALRIYDLIVGFEKVPPNALTFELMLSISDKHATREDWIQYVQYVHQFINQYDDHPPLPFSVYRRLLITYRDLSLLNEAEMLFNQLLEIPWFRGSFKDPVSIASMINTSSSTSRFSGIVSGKDDSDCKLNDDTNIEDEEDEFEQFLMEEDEDEENNKQASKNTNDEKNRK